MAISTKTQMALEEENKRLRQKINDLIASNLELSDRLSYTYNPDKPVRPLTLQEKLEINMGNSLHRYRIPKQPIKNIYFTIIREEVEPEFIDITFDGNRMFTAFYIVDLEKEAEEIKKGEELEVNIENISETEDNTGLIEKYDTDKVLNHLTDIDGVNNNNNNNDDHDE